MSLNAEFFGLPFHMASYSYSIFPMIVAAWLASIVEPWLKKVIPTVLRMIFVPLCEVVIVSLAIMLILGPAVRFVSEGIASTLMWIYHISPTISGLIIGGFYQCLVIFGLHWAVIPIVTDQVSGPGGDSPINAIISATMVAQGGAVLAIFLKTKLLKIKELAGPAAISAFCGITEPAMYGINREIRPRVHHGVNWWRSGRNSDWHVQRHHVRIHGFTRWVPVVPPARSGHRRQLLGLPHSFSYVTGRLVCADVLLRLQRQ